MRKLFLVSLFYLSSALILAAPPDEKSQRIGIRTQSAEAAATVSRQAAEKHESRFTLLKGNEIVKINEAPVDSGVKKPRESGVATIGSTLEMMRAATEGAQVYGNVVWSEAAEGETKNIHQGIWKISSDGTFTPVHPESLHGGWSAVAVNGVYHNFIQTRLGDKVDTWCNSYDLTTWDEVQIPVDTIAIENFPYTLCTDGTNVYGQYLNGKQWKFGKFDVNNHSFTFIAKCEKQWNGLAYGNDGMCYAIDKDGKLMKVNPGTGIMTDVGFTGIKDDMFTGATIDPRTGRMFWSVAKHGQTASGYLYEIDLTDATPTLLCQFPYNDVVSGIFCPIFAKDKAPAAVTDLTARFLNGKTSGTVSFYLPQTLYDGTAVGSSDKVNYKILVNGESVATGKQKYGTKVNKNLTLTDGKQQIKVIAYNETGDGPTEYINIYVGKDTPTSPEVTLSYLDGKFNVEWNPVTTTEHGGYMDATAVTYSVKRFPDEATVAENIKAISLEDEVEMPDTYKTYYYEVTAHAGELSSAPGKSNSIILGAYHPPYTWGFDSASELDYFTISDANKDNTTWVYVDEYGYVRLNYNKENSADDWLISPGIELEADQTYKISVEMSNGNENFRERFEVKAGTSPNAQSMTTSVIAPSLIPGSAVFPYTGTFEGYFTPSVSGNYCIGVHGISDADCDFITISSLSVSEPMDGNVPGMPMDVTVIPDDHGALAATVTGKAPTTLLNGKPLASIDRIEVSSDGFPITTLDHITPGADFTVVDNQVPYEGEIHYEIVTYNSNGGSPMKILTCTVGLDRPTSVTNLQMEENEPGKVTLSWSAPEFDINGKYMETGYT